MPPKDEFYDLVQESIDDELSDMRDWSALAADASNAEVREIITSMVGDEYGHARVWATILSQDPPKAKPQQPIGENAWCDGVCRAIVGELTAVSRYAQMARLAPDEQTRLIIMNIAGDEYQHFKIWTMIHIIYCCQG